MSGCGEAKIKSEYLIAAVGFEGENGVKVSDLPANNNLTLTAEKRRNQEPDDTSSQAKKPKGDRTGQNKHRPGPHKFANEGKLCSVLYDGKPDVKCENSSCRFMHDIQAYLASKTRVLPEVCPNYSRIGKCPTGLACVFAASHTNSENENVVNQELWERNEGDYEKVHRNIVDKDTRTTLRKKQYDFSKVDKLCQDLLNAKSVEAKALVQGNARKTLGAFTDEESVGLRPGEIQKIQWQDKLYLSPLTTVGNLPFRRICVDFGADITCSEMSLATSLLQGSFHEYALLKRHPCEKIWGIQLCANNGFIAAKTTKLLADLGVDYDFIDLNMGCPLEPIFVQGAGSGLMCRKNKFQGMVKCMTGTLKALGKPFTVKMRTGIKLEKNFAHELIPVCRDLGVDLVTLHGRTKDQRYLKRANWEYIGECKKVASPMPLFGNGDILSYEDYVENKKLSGVDGVMIGRGALTKPWIFQEIKENRHIDLSSSERLDIVRRYCNYGLEHWGSDCQGVETTRKFLLEWLSFTHRYIPYGILEEPPQRINQRPPKYFGRDDMETLLASPIVTDWIKISEMFLGPIPDDFQFLPKHKANSWG